MEEDPFVFIGFLGNIFGFLLNLFLIFVVVVTRRNRHLTDYSLIVLINCAIDVLFAVEQAFSQHRLVIADGILFIFPHGLERRLFGTHWIGLSFFWHIFSPVQAVSVLPTLFYYRYTIVSGRPKVCTLVKLMCLSTAFTLFVASTAAYGIHQGNCEPNPLYLLILKAKGLDAHPNEFYVLDVQYIGAMAFTLLAGGGCTVCLILVVLIIIKTWRFMRNFTVEVQSGQSKSLQKQFTRYLVAQTISGILFAIGPVAFINMCISFKVYANYTFILIPSCYLAVLNALLTMLMVGSYRKFVEHMLKNFGSFRSISKIHASTTGAVTREKFSFRA